MYLNAKMILLRNTKQKKKRKEVEKERKEAEKVCKEAQKAFAQANRDMRKQCSGQCLRRATQCIRCSLEDEICDDEDDDDNDDDDESSRRRRRTKNSDPQKIKQVKESLRNCPLVSKADLKELKDDIKDVKDENKTLKKDIEDKKQDLIDLNSDRTKAKQEAQDKLDTLEKEHRKIEKQFKKDLEGVSEQAKKEVEETKNRIDKAEGEIQELKLKAIDADDAFEQGRLEAEGKCHEAALKQVGEKRLKLAKLMASGRSVQRGGFQSLMKKAGLSSKERAKILVLNLRRECMNDKLFKIQMTTLRKSTAKTKARINLLIQGRELEISKLREGAKEILERAFKRGEEVKEENAENKADKEKEIHRAKMRAMTEDAEFQSKIKRLGEQIQTLQRERQELEDFIANKQRILGLKKKGSSGLRDEPNEAIGAVELMKDASREVRYQCDCSANPRSCESANRILNEIFPFEDYGLEDDISLPTTPTTPTTTSPPTTQDGSGAAP